MEQKKTLWIVASAGIFLLVVFGAALILYKPLSNQTPQQARANYDTSNLGWLGTPSQTLPASDSGLKFNNETPVQTEQSSISSLTPSPFSEPQASEKTSFDQNPLHTENLTVISDNATVYSNETTTIDLNALKSNPNSGVVAKNEMTANQLNSASAETSRRNQEEISDDNYYTPAPVTKAAPKKAAPKASKPAPKKTVAKKAAESPKQAPAKKVAATAKKAQNTFWVQAAAYTSKRNADDARNTLESNKIPSEVFTFTDSSGKTFYRVRVGPYITKSEAEYWQTRIAMIDKFASSKSVIVNTAVN